MTITNTYLSTPGEILKEEFLDPLGISQYRLAKAIRKPQSAISDIVNGRRAITPGMAVLLGRALSTTPEFWINLETTYQLKMIDDKEIHLDDIPDLVARAK
jgi:addiction module HigA family antidote